MEHKIPLSTLQSCYHWPAKTYINSSWISPQLLSVDQKTRQKKYHVPLKQYVIEAPMEWIAIDILVQLPETPWKHKFILLVGDFLTKWTETDPIPN